MNYIRPHGFCDLNISADTNNLRQTVLHALKLGYETIAINAEVSDEVVKSKKNKKGTYVEIPKPTLLSFSEEELKNYGIIKIPLILSRITIKFSEPSSPFLHKSKESLGKYDIIAYKPLTENAFKHLCQSSVDVDIISFDINDTQYRPSRKLIYLAINSDIYFEISYGPCIRSSMHRQKTIQFAQELHSLSRSLNIVVTSAAQHPSDLRNPYDVANLGLLFCLTPAASKAAISKTATDLIHCTRMRRTGQSKCSAQVEIFKNLPKKGKFSSLIALENLIDNT